MTVSTRETGNAPSFFQVFVAMMYFSL